MQHFGELLQTIKPKLELLKAHMTIPDSRESYNCKKCKDQNYIIDLNKKSAKACACLISENLNKRIKNAMIPSRLQHCELANFYMEEECHKLMYKAAKEYIEKFEEIKDKPKNSLGFIAMLGESEIKQMPKEKQAEYWAKYNSYGIGKSHIAMAIAKELIKKGYSVLAVSGVKLLENLTDLSFEDKEKKRKTLQSLEEVDVLVWDEIGKRRSSDFVQDIYYRIIDYRNVQNKPIIYTSNESVDSLADRIGRDSASRLFGMSYECLQLHGSDQRMR